MQPEKPKVLCVDDEEAILEGLTLHLRRRFQVVPCTSGRMALDYLTGDPDVAVILSDMRMPGMSGAELLAQARQVAPSAIRLLLTGHTDLESAIAAINEGQIFRFLTKPCPPPALLQAVEAAAELHRLRSAEKVLLEQTLHGAVKVLVEVLSLAAPDASGRALRIQNLCKKLASELGTEDRWQLEVAAMLSHLGYVTLRPETATKVLAGAALSPEEEKATEKMPALVDSLLEPIPRLEGVREILAHVHRGARKGQANRELTSIQRNTMLLRTAFALDRMEGSATPGSITPETVRAALPETPEDIVNCAIRLAQAFEGRADEVRDLPFAGLKCGMVLVREVRNNAGVLIVPRGFEVTESFLAKVRNFPESSLPKTVKVVLKAT